ncbi:protein phosphatase 2C domain-containing protein [Patescibacteria group bacterium]|nr:protein phosphatase 2C domain-containing protein [Patescibacteria group bacterium]
MPKESENILHFYESFDDDDTSSKNEIQESLELQSLFFDVSYHSELGPREENQDRIAFTVENDGTIVVGVFDGLGGPSGGAEAAETAKQVIETSKSDICERLIEADAQIKKTRLALGHPRMATTGTIARIKPDGTGKVAHAGDTRAYLYKPETHKLIQITRDDNPIDKNGNVIQHVVENSLGNLDYVQERDFILKPGEWLLLTSDGIHDYLDESFIRSMPLSVSRAINHHNPAEYLCYEAALTFSGDNSTALFVRRTPLEEIEDFQSDTNEEILDTLA